MEALSPCLAYLGGTFLREVTSTIQSLIPESVKARQVRSILEYRIEWTCVPFERIPKS